MCNLYVNKPVIKKEKGWVREGLGVWDLQKQTIRVMMDKLQGPTTQRRELY